MALYTSRARRAARERARNPAMDSREAERKADRFYQIDKVIREYEAAYLAANGTALNLVYDRGYVKVGANKYRLSELETYTRTLWARVHEREMGQ